MPQSTRNLILAAVAVVVVGGLGFMVLRSRSETSSRAAAMKDAAEQRSNRTTVSALGRLEPEGGVIDVGGMAGERVDRLLVAEGDQVTAGQELAYLASYPLRQSEQQLAEVQLSEAKSRSHAEQAYGAALVAEAEAAMDELKLADLDEQALRAKIEALELNVKIASRDSERLAGAGDIIAPQEHDHQELVVEQAKAELNSTRAQMAKLEAGRATHEREAKAKLNTAKANYARLQSAGQLESLEKGLTAATQKVEMSVIRAPRNGRVLRIMTRVGETVGPRPILRLGDTEHMYATAEIYETDVHLVRKGQQARITSDALPAPLTGTVESVGKTVAKNEVVSLDPTASADARVVLARIRLDDSREAAGLVDLQVDVVIDTAQPSSATQASTRSPGN